MAVISPDGVVTAVGPGTAIITARNEGALGLASVTVRPAALTALDVTPASVALSVNPAFSNAPVLLRTLGQLANGSSVDLTLSTSGTTYTSSNPAVAMVSTDGAILGLSGGNATITVNNGGVQTQIPVAVEVFSPIPTVAYNTPGYAYNVDIKGNLVFVADGVSGLQIFQTNNAAVFGKLAFLGNQAFDVQVRDNIAAVALSGGLAIVDVTNPAQPKELSRVSNIGSVRDVWISGNKVYTASSTGFRVYDISNLGVNPAPGGGATGFNATAVAADTARGVAVVLTSQPAVRVYQIQGSGPWSHVTLPLTVADNHADDVTLFGTSAYVANGRNGVREVDITNPAAPAFKASSSINMNALGVAVQRVNQGVLVAAADNIFFNAVPLFNAQLSNTATVEYYFSPQWQSVTVRRDADGTGIALGDGYGVVTVGNDGIQIFRTRQIVDNAGEPPTVSITSPLGGASVLPGVLTSVEATAIDDVGVSFVEFFLDDLSVGVDTTAPFGVQFSPGTPCTTQTLRARAIDDYGNFGDSLDVNVRVLCMDGQPCSSDSDCANNVCTSNVCQAPCNLIYPSCADLKDACPTAPSGTYPIDPDGSGPEPSFQNYCDMTRDGGGWTLIAKMTNQDAKNWVNGKTSWTDANFYGNTQDLSPGQDAKSRAWGTLVADELMLADNQDPAGEQYIKTTSGCLEGLTASQFFTAALAGYPTLSGQTWYKTCQVFNNYVPGWTVEPNWLDGFEQSPNNALTQGYLVIGRSDEDDTFGVISFYSTGEMLVGPNYDPFLDATGEYEADVGLSASERNGAPFGTFGDAQDIGGPLSCNLSDATCRTDYPQTVFVFAR